MSDAWASWQGHVLNGAFRLRRYLGCSDHSAVFLSEFTARAGAEVALKLVPAVAARPGSQLAEWRAAAALAHPHLIRLLGTGECQVNERAYWYVVMEPADQSLAQLLTQRPLTEEEAREMLQPALAALGFLHSRNLVQGQMKPANLLAVGDQLKLASDSVGPIRDAGTGRNTVSVYDPPEAQDGSYSTAGDVWGLGVTLFEALTRTPLLSIAEHVAAISLPREFSPPLRELVAACLSRRPYDRPKVAEIESWLRRQAGASPAPGPKPPERPGERHGGGAAAVAPPAAEARARAPAERGSNATAAPAAAAAPPPAVSGGTGAKAASPSAVPAAAAKIVKKATATTEAPSVAPPPAARAQVPVAGYHGGIVHARVNQAMVAQSEAAYAARVQALAEHEAGGVWRSLLQSLKLQPAMPLLLAVVAALALGWLGLRALIGHRTHAPAVTSPQAALPEQPSATVAAAVLPSSPPAVTPAARTRPLPASADGASAAVHEEIPSVPQRARRTIRGHIHVSVRVIVGPDGNVTAALVDNPGPSRYFARLAIEAAKKWTFAPAPSEPRRLKSVRFEFSREGSSGHAVALH